MKRTLILAIALALCTGAALFADDAMKNDDTMKSGAMKSEKTMTAHGTITRIDNDGKMMTMKDAHGKEMTMSWDESTKVMGDMKEGAMATVHYQMKDGKMMAHSVTMKGAMKNDMKGDMKK